MNNEETKTPVAGAIDRAPDVAAMFDELALGMTSGTGS